jgi:cysteine desulfurase/selenocysteine lyase
MKTIDLVQTLNVELLRTEFPILGQKINGMPLVYLDNAATTQKPRSVINALTNYYLNYNANIHRGVHTLAEHATQAFEETRETAKTFINASSTEEIIFVRGVTEAINLVASAYGMTFIREGDEIIIYALEHHSNIVPWQWICEKRKAVLKVIPINSRGEIDINRLSGLLTDRTKLLALAHASNSLGTLNPVKEIIELAQKRGAVVLIDGAQAGAHVGIDVQDLGCDFYCLSAHKMYGPAGVGILYGKKELLDQMPPYQGGGEMIREVNFSHTTYNDLPYKFEAGTPAIADVIAFNYAMHFLLRLGQGSVARHEQELLQYAADMVGDLPFVSIIGTARQKVGVLSFVVQDVHPFDIGNMLDARGVAVRTGHHCTQPLMATLGVNGTVRASFAVYNTKSEVDTLVEALKKIIPILRP